jgi:hypothetical protein
MSDALPISRDLRAKDIVKIVYESNDDYKGSLNELLDTARKQATFKQRWSRRTIPGLAIGIAQITPDIPIPFTGRQERKTAEQDLKRLDKLQLFQTHAELVRGGQYEMARQVLQDLMTKTS